MRIEYLRLVNHTGILAGTGRSEIEIEFPDPGGLQSRIILLMGRNGSGKSTLLSTLHPFSGLFDQNREDSSVVPAGREGLKQVRMVRADGAVFEIEHHYLRSRGALKTKSYISRDGEELNPNGGVNTFEARVREEFGLTGDYFRVGRLAATARSFVQLTAGARKDFIVSHLPSAEPYVEAHRAASERCRQTEKSLKFLADEMGKLETEEVLLGRRDEALRTLRAAERARDAAAARLDRARERLSGLETTEAVADVDHLTREAEEADADLAGLEAELASVLRKARWIAEIPEGGLQARIASGREKAARLSGALDAKRASATEVAGRVASLRASIASKERELAKYSSVGESEEELRDMLSDLERMLEGSRERQSRLAERLPWALDAWDAVSTLRTRDRQLLRTATRRILSAVGEALSEADSAGDRGAVISLAVGGRCGKGAKKREALRSRLERELAGALDEESRLSALAQSAELLESRPKGCRIDSCPFVVEGVRGRDAEAELAGVAGRIEELRGELGRVSTEEREAEAAAKILATFSELHAEVSSEPGPNGPDVWGVVLAMSEGAIDASSPSRLLESCLDAGQLTLTPRLSSEAVMDLVEATEDVSTAESNIEDVSKRLEAVTNSAGFTRAIRADVARMRSELEGVEARREALAAEMDGEAAEADRVSGALNLLERYAELLATASAAGERGARARESLEKLAGVVSEIAEVRGAVATAEGELAAEVASREAAGRALTAAEVSLVRLAEFRERHERFSADYAAEKAVRDACDPKRGIPLAHTRRFLERTKAAANELLDDAYGGRFRIDFEVTEREFLIPVRKTDGETLPDVKVGSDGERAMVTSILSLALLGRYLRLYPIFCLDEVDAVLDEHFRPMFATILGGQIDRLGLTQVFVISHNEEFRDSSTNVILFPGHTLSESAGNRVIADFS